MLLVENGRRRAALPYLHERYLISADSLFVCPCASVPRVPPQVSLRAVHKWVGLFPQSFVAQPNSSARLPPPSKNTMKQFQTTLPPVRRIVTAHDISGREIIRSDSSMLAKVERAFAKVAATDTYPLTVCIPIQRCSGKNMGDRLFPFQRQQYRVSFIRSLGVFQWVG